MSKIVMTVDGNTAAAYVAYAFTEVASIYPITPSSTMAEVVDQWAADGRKNIFGDTVRVIEMQSEAGAAGTFHGALQAGALTTTFTASQGLLLMIPNMYKVSGELLPGVFHVSARAIAAQALSIFGDHQDVMAVRQTGCVLLASSSVQQVMDLAPIAHLSAIKGRIPVVHFFDGFRTSHEIQKIEGFEYSDYEQMLDMDALQSFRANALSPNHPVIRGTAQNPDIYFQTREACNSFYNDDIHIVEEYMKKISRMTGREYNLFNYYGAPDARYVIVAMGSVCETIEETVDYLNSKGEKTGVINVHLYRPFSIEHFIASVPETVEAIAVLDRTKEPGSAGEPLYLDVRNSFYDVENHPIIVGGRYGLGSKDTTPSNIKTVFDNLKKITPKNNYTIGITDDITHTSLPVMEKINAASNTVHRCKFWGLGSDGTVGANKQAVKIIGEHTDKYVQAYFAYDSKKSGGLTVSHLRFDDKPIKSTYLIDEADYVACHNQSYVNTYDMIKDLKQGGIFVLNCKWSKDELKEYLPAKMLREIAEKDIDFYCIDAGRIASDVGLGNRINMIMQGVFFKLTQIIPNVDAIDYLKKAIEKTYGRKGENIVKMNYDAVEKGFSSLQKIAVCKEWTTLEDDNSNIKEPEFIATIMRPMQKEEGNNLPISVFKGIEDGTFPSGTTAYEKRGIGVSIPQWIPKNCIQCNQCSFICPHSCIRPFLLTNEEKDNSSDCFVTKKAAGFEDYEYRIQVSPMDCTGCGNCADICPAKNKALVMQKIDTQLQTEVPNWKYAIENVSEKSNEITTINVRNSQFKPPLMEFSGACAGCGEPAYIKLVTQLFGDRMMIANATGCSSIWGASAPATSYTCNKEGKGPAWANSLFEDNAEYGLGMCIGANKIRNRMIAHLYKLSKGDIDNNSKDIINEWLGKCNESDNIDNGKLIRTINSISTNDRELNDLISRIKNNSDYLTKRSVWIVGGDGWAYDIGFSGVDHAISTGENINILVFDTEIYSNTGGQASKSTPLSAIAKFASGGKRSGKKNLGLMMMTYKNVYVAQIAMGADKNQTLKAIIEAEQYDGPSIIIAYAPCISHGMKEGMGRSMNNMAQAVDTGYWHLYRYNPMLAKRGENPFILDSKDPNGDFREYILNQLRYYSLRKQNPEQAEYLFEQAQIQAINRIEDYKKLL